MKYNDSIEMLRADLKHFEDHCGFGEDATISDIKGHLLNRIATLEIALRRLAELEGNVAPH